jgi:soluble lytic murein transglycosylase
LGALAAPLWAQGEANWQRMRAAYVKRDIDALSALRSRVPADHVLRPLADYWGLSARLPDASVEEVEAFFKQWRGSYYEDRLRNEWMRLLGQRGDWAQLLAQDRLFRMQDDDDVACWVALAQGQVHGRWLTASLQRAWDAQRVKGEGCIAAAGAFMAQGQWPQQQVFEAVRKAVEYGRRREAKALAELIDPALAKAADDAIRRPQRALKRATAKALRPWRSEVKTWAWVRRVKRQPGEWRTWRKALQQAGLSAEQGRWVRNTLGMWMALNQDWAALQVFDARRSPADDTHSECRFRSAVIAQDWPKLHTWLQKTPEVVDDCGIP